MRSGEEFAQHGFDLLSKRSEPEQYFTRSSSMVSSTPRKTRGRCRLPIRILCTYRFGPRRIILRRSARGPLRSIATIWPAKSSTSFVRLHSSKTRATGEPRDNYRTYFTFAELLGVLPLRCITIADVGLIPTWLNSKYDRGLVPHALSKGLPSVSSMMAVQKVPKKPALSSKHA